MPIFSKLFNKLASLYYRSFDERCRAKINQIEERFSQEKRDLLTELEKVVLKGVLYWCKIFEMF